MTCALSRGALAAALLLLAGLPACPKPAAPDQRGSGDPRAAGDPPPAVKRYPLRLHRPLKPGMRYKVALTGNMDTETTVNGKGNSNPVGRLSYVYEAVVTVKAAHACGKATREEHRIAKLQLTRSGGPKDLLQAGTVVLAEAVGSKEKFTVKGKPVTGMTAKVLEYAVDLFKGDTSTVDEIFGPSGPVRPGDTWAPKKVKMLTSLRHQLKNPVLWPQPSQVTGKVTFVGPRRVKGRDFLEFKVEVQIENIAPSLGTVQVKSGTVALVITGLVPRDPQAPFSGAVNMTMTMQVEGEFPQKNQMGKMAVHVVNAQRSTRTALK